MHLSHENAKLFYKIWLGLLSYVNEKYSVKPEIGEMKSPAGLDVNKVVAIRNKLWEHKEIIDEYIEKNADILIEREINILKSWESHNIGGEFILLKYLKKYSVFLTTDENPKLYGVVGITNSIDEIFPLLRLPLYVEAVFLQFEDKIIYDGFIIPYIVSFGSGYVRSFNDTYREVKEKDGIIVDLISANIPPATKTKKPAKKKFPKMGRG
jgi:hypothetical protein